jgi:hypothetical protein
MPRPAGSQNKETGSKVDESIITWLDIPENRNIIDGKQTHGAPQSGKGISKITGFNRMAEHVNQTCGTCYTGTQMQGKFSYWRAKFSKAVAFQSAGSSGEGITDFDIANDIHTIADKLESICPFYYKWEEFYGEKPNMRPRFLVGSEVIDDNNSGPSNLRDMTHHSMFYDQMSEEISEESDLEQQNINTPVNVNPINATTDRNKKRKFVIEASESKGKNFRTDFYETRKAALEVGMKFEQEKTELEREKYQSLKVIETEKLEIEVTDTPVTRYLVVQK